MLQRPRLTISVLVAIIALLFISSCFLIPPIEVEIGQPEVLATLSFINAKSGDVLQDSIQVSFKQLTGFKSLRITDLLGSEAQDFKVTSGFLSIGLQGVKPSEDKPVELLVVASAEGYLETSMPLFLSDLKNPPMTIAMVKLSEPPDGVQTSEADVPTNGQGMTSQAITISSGPEAKTGALATLNIAANTSMKDAEGKPVTGKVQATLAYFSNQEEASIGAFPGGLAAHVNNAQGQEEDVFFTTGGFVAVEIRSDTGQEVKQFDPPITMSLDVPAETVNPETGLSVKAGDTLPVWSYETTSGRWQHETEGILFGPNAEGNFTLSYEANHLSYWNLDWKGPSCSTGITLNIVGNTAGVPILLRLYNAQSEGYLNRTQWFNDNSITFRRPPADAPVRIIAYVRSNSDALIQVGEIVISNMCERRTYNLAINLSGQPEPDPITLNVDATAICIVRGVRVVVRPDIPAWYKPAGSSEWIWAGWMIDGQLRIENIDANSFNDVMTEVLGQRYTASYFVGDAPNISLEALISDLDCDNLTQ